MAKIFTLRRFIKFQEQDIDRIDLTIDIHNEICFARIFLKPNSITVSCQTAKNIAKAFPDKITPI
jgi:hypothetical protein